MAAEDQFILLACDGLFDVFNNDEIITFVKEFMEKTPDTQKCCQAICVFIVRFLNS